MSLGPLHERRHETGKWLWLPNDALLGASAIMPAANPPSGDTVLGPCQGEAEDAAGWLQVPAPLASDLRQLM